MQIFYICDPRWTLVTGSGGTVAEICDKIPPGCCRYSAAGKIGWATLVEPSSFDRPTRVSYPTLPEPTPELDRIAGRRFDHVVESLPGMVRQFTLLGCTLFNHLLEVDYAWFHPFSLPFSCLTPSTSSILATLNKKYAS